LDDGSTVERVVDLAFREDTPDFAGWTVVDFKTHREFAILFARYIAQGEDLFTSGIRGDRLAGAGQRVDAL
jgi:hypothetical protein